MAKKPKKQGPTAQERESARVGMQRWNTYKSQYIPAEKALIDKSEFTAGERARVRGEVAGDTAAAFKGLARNTVASGGIAGADVNSGKTKLAMAANAAAQGQASGVGQSVAITGGNIDSDQQKASIAAIGQGVSGAAQSNLSRGAQRATSLALAASQAKFEKNIAMVEGAATVAGAAVRKYGNFKQDQKLDLEADKQLWGSLDSGLNDFLGETDYGLRTMKDATNKFTFDAFGERPNILKGVGNPFGGGG